VTTATAPAILVIVAFVSGRLWIAVAASAPLALTALLIAPASDTLPSPPTPL
jgi:hypothetical protein